MHSMKKNKTKILNYSTRIYFLRVVKSPKNDSECSKVGC